MWRQARTLNQKLFPQFESLKQGRLSKLFDLYSDYTQALKDTFVIIKKKPVRSAIYGTVISISLFCNKKNPDMESYKERLLEASNSHSLISDLIRNKNSSGEIKKLMKYSAEDRLRRVNLGVFSLILLDEYSSDHHSFEKHCSSIQPRWIYLDEWKERIKDFGFVGQWYYLERTMVDYDINEDEFQ